MPHGLLTATFANLSKQQCIFIFFYLGKKGIEQASLPAPSLNHREHIGSNNITSRRFWHRRRNITAGVLAQHFQFGSEIYCTLSFSKTELYCESHYYQIYIHIHNYISNLNSQNILSKFPSLVFSKQEMTKENESYRSRRQKYTNMTEILFICKLTTKDSNIEHALSINYNSFVSNMHWDINL